MSKTAFNEYIKPFVVLVAICLIVSALLAATHSVTEPVIEENARIEAENTRREVLPGSSDFTELDVEGIDGVNSAYRENSGAGFVATAGYRGYGGEVVVTLGLDNDGRIVGISADVGSETKRIGSKAGERSYLDGFMGQSGTLTGVDKISGASYSSNAVRNDVTAILAAFDRIKEAGEK